jgi:hypothetical protein
MTLPSVNTAVPPGGVATNCGGFAVSDIMPLADGSASHWRQAELVCPDYFMLTRLKANHVDGSHASLYPIGRSGALCRFYLGWGTWKMAFTVGAGQSSRIRTVPARLTSSVLHEIKKAKLRFSLPQTPRWCRATRPSATAFGSIASCSTREFKTSSSTRRRSSQPAQAPSEIGSPRRHQAGVDAHSVAQR